MINNSRFYLEKISDNVLKTSFENFDQKTLENAKNRTLDLIGCAISGAEAKGNPALVDLIKSWGGKEESTVLIYGGKVPAHNAAMVNSIMARSYDFEAIGAFVDGADLPSHISVTTVMTALALGEAKNANGKEFITALLAGDDIACRVLAASNFGFALGWDGNGTINAFGATAVAGRLLGLTPSQMQNAFGIMLNQLAGSFQNIWDGSLCFKFPNGLSARNGIFSAELAKTGWDGPKDALFGKYGYFDLYTEGCTEPDILIKDLGKKYYTEATFKPYSCCRANHAAIDCALKIINEQEVDINKIEEIVLNVSPRVRDMFVGQPFKVRENPQIDAAFSLRFCVANVLLRKTISIDHFQENYIKEPEISFIANKVKVESLRSSELNKKSATLKVKMTGGKEYFAEIDFPKGGPVHNSLSKEEIREKFLKNIAFSKKISESKGKKIISLIENLEEVEDISELIYLVTV